MTPLDEAVLERFRDDLSYREIGDELGITKNKVSGIVSRLRRELGEEEIPKRNRLKMSKAWSEEHGTSHYYDNLQIVTWAGAFKVLAHRLRDFGDAEGWKMAQEIAEKKGMSL